jgi:alpha-tubulin suppressor-like RCC1 family protein
VQVLTSAAAVAAGNSHTLAIKQDGSLWAWGHNFYGQLGDGSNNWERSTPVQVQTGVSAVSAGYYHSVMLKQDGSVWSFGSSTKGQLGDGSSGTRPTPVRVLGL